VFFFSAEMADRDATFMQMNLARLTTLEAPTTTT